MTNEIIKPASFMPGRRRFLTTGGKLTLSAAAITLLAGCEGMRQSMADKKSSSADSMASDVAILNGAIDAEHEAIAAYQLGAESGLLSKGVLDVAVAFQGDHKEHANLLASTVGQLGGTPNGPQASYDFPVEKLKSERDVVEFAAGLEKGAVEAYVAAIPMFGNKDLAQAAGKILGAEAMHWATLRGALGLNPVPSPFVG